MSDEEEEDDENGGKGESFNCSPSPMFNFKEIPFMTAALSIVGSHSTGEASDIQHNFVHG